MGEAKRKAAERQAKYYSGNTPEGRLLIDVNNRLARAVADGIPVPVALHVVANVLGWSLAMMSDEDRADEVGKVAAIMLGAAKAREAGAHAFEAPARETMS